MQIDERTTCKLSHDEKKAIREASAIIIDEAPMCSNQLIECLDKDLRDITKNDRLMFGGITVIFGGDFRQTLPVVKYGTPADSYLPQKMESLGFRRAQAASQNMRAAPGEQAFANYLLRLGDGDIPVIDGKYLIEVPNECVAQTDEDLTKIRLWHATAYYHREFD